MGLDLLYLSDVVKEDNHLGPIFNERGLELDVLLVGTLSLEDEAFSKFEALQVHFPLYEVPKCLVVNVGVPREREATYCLPLLG